MGAFFSNGGNWGQMGTNVLVEFEIFFYNWGHFFPIGGNLSQRGQMCMKNLKKKLIGGIFYSWGQNVIWGSRKPAFLRIIG